VESAGSGSLFNVGNGTSQIVTLYLTNANNFLTNATLNVGVSVHNNGGTCVLNLGTNINVLASDTILVGDGKSIGTIQFVTPSGSLVIRNRAGTGRATINMGRDGSGSSANPNGTIILNGHSVDVLASTIDIGDNAGASGVGSPRTVNFSFDTGAVDSAAVTMAVKSAAQNNVINSFLNIGGGTLNAGSISLVNQSSAGGTYAGTVTVTNGGIVNCTNGITKATATGTGTLIVT